MRPFQQFHGRITLASTHIARELHIKKRDQKAFRDEDLSSPLLQPEMMCPFLALKLVV